MSSDAQKADDTTAAPRERLQDLRSRVLRWLRADPARPAAILVSLLAGLLVYGLATGVFPYHSSNHDEAVYLQQAELLLAGQLQLFPGEHLEAVRPWFFVAEEGRLYPKYAPYPAALYAIPMALVGEPRVALGALAAANAALVYWLGAAAVDRRVGVVAAALFAVSPMTLVTSSVFLPYAPTTTLNLAFAVLYLRGVRTGRVRAAVGAGLATGLAFFARPYTAVLFATPFIFHACWSVARAVRNHGIAGSLQRPLPDPIARNAATATAGLAFVALTLAYNAFLTGDPLVFPYEAFAPMDGPGFGQRRILGHAIEYTPEVALEANGYVLWYLASRWVVAGLLGTALAVLGGILAVRRWQRTDWNARPMALIGGLLVSVPLGNLAFWGNYNVLATPGDPTDGLISQFGPFYHFDLLVPVSILAALALVTGWRRLRRGDAVGRRGAVGVAAIVLVVLLAATAAALGPPLDRNLAYTETYEDAYEPIENADFEHDLVFVPTPYGDWLNHPFQPLRNDPGFDGEVVYALDRGPDTTFAMIDAYPNRSYHRYTYRGEWTPDRNQGVAPKLEPLDVREGANIAGTTTVGVPDSARRGRVRLSTPDEGVTEELDPSAFEAVDGNLTVGWHAVAGNEATESSGSRDAPAVELSTVDGQTVDTTALSLPNGTATTVVLSVRFVDRNGASFTYRQAATVRVVDGRVEVVWPPERTTCALVDRCGREGTYLPDQPDQHRSFVAFETRLTADEQSR